MSIKLALLVAVACSALVLVPASAAATVSSPVRVTDDQFAANEESLGMSPDGQILMGMWNDWHFNDGCGISYSTDGGTTWAPESFAPGFTSFTNDPNVAGSGIYAAAGDPVDLYNPKSGLFDVICQSFGGLKNKSRIQLLATTFDPAAADPSDPADSYGLGAWRLPAVPITTGTANGSQKGSNGTFPDHEAGAVDTGSGPGHHFGRVYSAWAQFDGSGGSPILLAYSDNDGASWTGPILVSDAGHQFDQDATNTVIPAATAAWRARSPARRSPADSQGVPSARRGTSQRPQLMVAMLARPSATIRLMASAVPWAKECTEDSGAS
jgi:hypothetical protein